MRRSALARPRVRASGRPRGPRSRSASAAIEREVSLAVSRPGPSSQQDAPPPPARRPCAPAERTRRIWRPRGRGDRTLGRQVVARASLSGPCGGPLDQARMTRASRRGDRGGRGGPDRWSTATRPPPARAVMPIDPSAASVRARRNPGPLPVGVERRRGRNAILLTQRPARPAGEVARVEQPHRGQVAGQPGPRRQQAVAAATFARCARAVSATTPAPSYSRAAPMSDSAPRRARSGARPFHWRRLTPPAPRGRVDQRTTAASSGSSSADGSSSDSSPPGSSSGFLRRRAAAALRSALGLRAQVVAVAQLADAERGRLRLDRGRGRLGRKRLHRRLLREVRGLSTSGSSSNNGSSPPRCSCAA